MLPGWLGRQSTIRILGTARRIRGPASGTAHLAPYASHAEHRRARRAPRRLDHQPRGARRRRARGAGEARERLRHPGRSRGRGGDHRDRAQGLSRPRLPRRGIGHHRAGRGVPLDHRSARRHDQLHPRLSAVLPCRSASSTAARSRTRWSTTRPGTSSSPPPRGAARSSTTGASASRSARGCGDALVGTGFPFKEVGRLDLYTRQLATIHADRRRRAPRGRRRARPRLRGVRPARRVLGARPLALGHGRRARSSSRRPAAWSATSRARRASWNRATSAPATPKVFTALLEALKA